MRLAGLGLAVALAVAGPAAASGFRLSSADLPDGGRIADVHVNRDCSGGDLSPALAWSGAPAATRSFAITIHDPDAPKAGGWWHWLAFDIPASTAGVPRGAAGGGLPAGARQGRNDYGNNGYDGPCPPPGPAHRYIVTLWALDVGRLAAAAGLAPGDLAAQLQAHALDHVTLVGIYGR